MAMLTEREIDTITNEFYSFFLWDQYSRSIKLSIST